MRNKMSGKDIDFRSVDPAVLHSQDAVFMAEALRLARKAASLGEVPIGCVIVRGDKIIARGYNRRNTDKNVLAHAEVSAIRRATKIVNDWRLEDCTLYVTLEPCQMCAGAIVQARMKRVVIGAMNPKAGCAGSIINLLQMKQFNHLVNLTIGIRREECSQILTDFFENLRGNREAVAAWGKGESSSGDDNDDNKEAFRKNCRSSRIMSNIKVDEQDIVDIWAEREKNNEHGRRRASEKRKPYRVFLWDVDGTLLNFLAAEKEAIRSCFKHFGLGECTDEMIERYSRINRKYWEALERGEITKERVLVGRYEEFFAEEGIDTSYAAPMNAEYQIRLGDTVVFCDDGYEIVKRFKGHVLQFAVTNGTAIAQEKKLRLSGLGELFDGVFISDLIGSEKPTKEFFVPVLAEIGRRKAAGELPADMTMDEVLIIGDSLTSDIKGGNNAGIPTCWYNPNHAENTKGVEITHEIHDLHQLIPLSGVHFR